MARYLYIFNLPITITYFYFKTNKVVTKKQDDKSKQTKTHQPESRQSGEKQQKSTTTTSARKQVQPVKIANKKQDEVANIDPKLEYNTKTFMIQVKLFFISTYILLKLKLKI